MSNQFVINEQGQRIAVIVPIAEYEELLHKRHITLDLTDEYKTMIDEMIEQERNNVVQYTPDSQIKERFGCK